MSIYAEMFNYLKQCPQLADLLTIAGTEEQGANIVLPQGSSSLAQYIDRKDVQGNYICDVVPYNSVYQDFQINCFRIYDVNDINIPSKNINVLNLDEVQSVCDWIAEQNEIGNLPKLTGLHVVSVECNPFVPQVRFINQQENSIAYFITIRVRYVNKAKRRVIEYDKYQD